MSKMIDKQIEVGQVIRLREFADSPIVTREIISIEGNRVFYRKSELNNQGHQRIGQISMKGLLACIEKHGVKEDTEQ